MAKSPSDYFRQGSYFDKFGDKSVWQRKTEGKIFPSDSYNGTRVAEQSQYDGCIYLSKPPSIRVAGYTSVYCLDMADLSVYRGNGTSCTGVWAFAVRGQYPLCPVVSFNIQAPGGKIARVNLACDFDAPAYYAYASLFESTFIQKYQGQRYDDCIEDAVNDTMSFIRSHSSLLRVEAWLYAQKRRYTYSTNVLSSPMVTSSVSVMLDDVSTRSKIGDPTFDSNEKSRQAREIIESFNEFDSNLIAYASDLKKTGDSIRSLLSLVSDIDNPKKWASAWLSMRYGDRLQISDTRELLESLRRSLTKRSMYTKVRRVFHGTHSIPGYTWRSYRALTMYADNGSYSGLETAILSLLRWDAWPTLENTWDTIPLSFVVDWFLPVSDILSQIDAAVEAPYIRPLSQFVGEKSILTFDYADNGWFGQVQVSTYRRYPHPILDDVTPFCDVTSLPSFSVVHTGDALALLVQTTRA
jgi:hypothetical protein